MFSRCMQQQLHIESMCKVHYLWHMLHDRVVVQLIATPYKHVQRLAGMCLQHVVPHRRVPTPRHGVHATRKPVAAAKTPVQGLVEAWCPKGRCGVPWEARDVVPQLALLGTKMGGKVKTHDCVVFKCVDDVALPLGG